MIPSRENLNPLFNMDKGFLFKESITFRVLLQDVLAEKMTYVAKTLIVHFFEKDRLRIVVVCINLFQDFVNQFYLSIEVLKLVQFLLYHVTHEEKGHLFL